MLVPTRKTVFIVDAMAFRRARVESFLSPWAANEKVELISLDPDEAHARLVERNECDMLIYSVGAPSAYEIFAEIQVLHTLRRQAALAIVSDDENPATVIAAIRSGAQGYFSNSMPPDLALQALSFVLHGGTYFPPTAIMASHTLGGGFPTESRQQVLLQEQPLPDAEQQRSAAAPWTGRRYLRTASLHPLRREGDRPPTRQWIQRRPACSRVYRAAIRRSHLSLPGRPQQGDRPQARNDGNDREGPCPGDHAQAGRMQPYASRHRRGARLLGQRRRTGSRGFIHDSQAVHLSLAMNFRHCVPERHCAITV